MFSRVSEALVTIGQFSAVVLRRKDKLQSYITYLSAGFYVTTLHDHRRDLLF